MLTVPLPTLDFEAVAPGVAALELPLTVGVGPVLDGEAAQTPVELRTFGLVSYRHPAAGVTEVWDAATQAWVSEGEQVEPVPLAYLADEASPWQGIVVAGGGEQFGAAVAGYPSYSFCALFATADELTMSGPTESITFGSVTDRNLMLLGPGDGEQPANATEARLQLRSTALQVIGGLVVRRGSPGADVALSNAAGAAVVLRPDGSIELRPAPGQGVVVAGDLETEQITYAPAGGGIKKTLA